MTKEHALQMWKKSKLNMHLIADKCVESQEQIKESLACLLKYGTTEEVADFIYEMTEHVVSEYLSKD